jgi:hypothetical protein
MSGWNNDQWGNQPQVQQDTKAGPGPTPGYSQTHIPQVLRRLPSQELEAMVSNRSHFMRVIDSNLRKKVNDPIFPIFFLLQAVGIRKPCEHVIA